MYLDTVMNAEKIVNPDYSTHDPKKALSSDKEFFSVLVRFRLGVLEEDLAYKLGLSQSQISWICITLFNFLHSCFRSYPIWPSRNSIDYTMP